MGIKPKTIPDSNGSTTAKLLIKQLKLKQACLFMVLRIVPDRDADIQMFDVLGLSPPHSTRNESRFHSVKGLQKQKHSTTETVAPLG